MILEHDSRNIIYRSPFGAVPCLSTIVLRLYAQTEEIPAAINLIYRFMDSGLITKPMHFISSIAKGSLYEAILDAPETPGLLWYYFELVVGNNTYYYGNNKEMLGGLGSIYNHILQEYQITIYNKDYKTPDWIKSSIVYQIFPDRFSKGDMDSFNSGRNDIIPRNWEDTPYYKAEQFGGEYLANDFFGGNLDGIIKKLPYLNQLGINTIYLNPIFKAFSNHKYDTGDYDVIDPMFGNNELFEKLCQEASSYGIKIILDGVFNHTGSNSRYFNKEATYPTLGAYQSKNSPYYSWYCFNNHPEDYASWWGFKTLPNTNEEDPSFIDYIINSPDSIIKKWLNMGAWGWRLDVADELPPQFIKLIRKACKAVKPDAVLIGEVWEDASNKISYGIQREYLLGEELDSVMNYPLRRALIDFACGYSNAQRFSYQIMSLYENYPKEAFYSLLNFLSTHDVERILTILGDAPDKGRISKDDKATYVLDEKHLALAIKRLNNVVLLQMTLPGVPCIYYGDEAGMQGYEDPFNRRTYPWGNEDPQVLSIYKTMIALRKQHQQFTTGAFEILYTYNYCLAYARHDSQKLIIVSVNMDKEHEVFARLDIARFSPTHTYDAITKDSIDIINGIITYVLPPLSHRVIEVGL